MSVKNGAPEFVHPVEAIFAQMLNHYGINWQYEPRTFVLAADTAGEIIEAFTPDFYLPDENLYVELTTLRPQLMTKKNRKMRLMEELYPETKVKLLRRRDLRDMLLQYGADGEAARLLGTTAQS